MVYDPLTSDPIPTPTPERTTAVEQLILEQLSTLRQEQQHGFDSLRKEFNSRIDRLVTQEAFNAEQRRVDDHIQRLGGDIVKETAERVSYQNKLATNMRWLAASVILPVVLFIGSIIAASEGGGSGG